MSVNVHMSTTKFGTGKNVIHHRGQHHTWTFIKSVNIAFPSINVLFHRDINNNDYIYLYTTRWNWLKLVKDVSNKQIKA